VKQNKDANFEIDVLPVISLLAVCISFLLVTAVWVHMGSLDLSQAIGSEEQNEAAPVVWAEFYENGNIEFTLKNLDPSNSSYSYAIVKSNRSSVNWESIEANIEQIKTRYPDINTVVVLPKGKSPYKDLVTLVDKFKKQSFKDVGISPL
jgi:biopolymer transport protein TolR